MKRGPVVWVAYATFAAHVLVANRYGFFRDELYFIDCGRHPAFGYVDQPPLAPLVAAATQLFGPCLPILRIIPALFHAATVLLTAKLARLVANEARATDDGYGPTLAAVSVAIGPMMLGLHTTFGTTTGEPLAWTAMAYLVARATLLGERRALVVAGVVAGVALEAKYALPFFLAPLLAGVLLGRDRRVLATREALLGALAACAIAAPSLAWQLGHGLPFLELLRAGSHGKNAVVPAGEFLANQAGVMNLVLAPVWIGGVVATFTPSYSRVRFLGVAFVGTLATMIALHGKDYYVAPAYPVILAVGAPFVAARVRATWARATHLVLALAMSAVAAPLAMPILAPDALVRYMRAMGMASQAQENAAKDAILPQEFADMLGWRELEARVAEVWRSLPDEERARAAIITSNYGEAGAIDFFGAKDGLPPAMSGHNAFYTWGTHGLDGSVVVRVNGNVDTWTHTLCREARVAATFGVPLAMPYEHDRPILVCYDLLEPLGSSWPEFKHYE